MNLQGKKVLVTGGSSGLGKCTAQLLINEGADVAITARRKDRLELAASEIGALPIIADVAKPQDVDATYDRFLSEFGKLDVLINNAGLAKGHAPLTDIKREDLEYVYSVNVFGAAMMAQGAARLFKEQKSGDIVNIASTAAHKGYPGGTIYSSSKFALRGMTYSWQTELRKYNVRVMLINPSYVPTAFGTKDGVQKPEEPGKLTSNEIAHSIISALKMDNRGFIPELSVWATNPYNED